MDGTLVDTEPFWLEAETELMARFNYTWRPEDQRHCLGGPLTRVGAYMAEKAGEGDSEFFVNELVSSVAEKFQTDLHFMPGAYELVEELKQCGIPLGLVSASPRILVDATLSRIGADVFDISISSEDVARNKPYPDPYLRAAELIHVDIANSLILEDSQTGISSAQSAGASVLAIPHIVTIAPHPKTVIINSLVGYDFAALSQLFHDRTSA